MGVSAHVNEKNACDFPAPLHGCSFLALDPLTRQDEIGGVVGVIRKVRRGRGVARDEITATRLTGLKSERGNDSVEGKRKLLTKGNVIAVS